MAAKALTLLALAASTLASPMKRQDATFQLTDITYNSDMLYSTPAHLAVYGGNIAFNLTSSRVDYLTSCSARGLHLQDMFYGEITYTCATPANSNTTFTFSRPDNKITLNQTWVEDGITYLAQGNGVADLQCTTTNYQNPDWQSGETYSSTNTDCAPTTLAMVPIVSQISS